MNRGCRLSLIGLIVLVAVGMFTGLAFAEGAWILTDKGAKVWDPSPEPNETVTWSGGVDSGGYTTGRGILQWFVNGRPDDKYEGTMSNGKRTGKGIYTWANGGRYEGDFVDGKRTGKGIETWTNGDRYEGDYVDGKRTKGIYVYGPNSRWAGDRYEGDFVDDKRTGKGLYTWADGERYEGDFVNDKRNGYGTYYPKNGNVQRGRWSDGKYLGP